MRGVTHKHCSHPSTSHAREKCRQNRPEIVAPRSHAECDHPSTNTARRHCREKRAEWDALMSEVMGEQ